VPAALEQIVFKVLSKEPSARYRTADQLGRVLMTFAPRTQPADLAPQSLPALTPLHRSDATTSPFALEPAKAAPLDWVAVALGLLAFLAVGGLVPLWLWACLMYPSCPLRIP